MDGLTAARLQQPGGYAALLTPVPIHNFRLYLYPALVLGQGFLGGRNPQQQRVHFPSEALTLNAARRQRRIWRPLLFVAWRVSTSICHFATNAALTSWIKSWSPQVGSFSAWWLNRDQPRYSCHLPTLVKQPTRRLDHGSLCHQRR
jgi:hypothetical protein